MERAIEIISGVCSKTIDYALVGIVIFAFLTLITVVAHPELRGTCVDLDTLYIVPIFFVVFCMGLIMGAVIINTITIKRIKEEIKNGKGS
jgi:multisubunit Na+/H+ antiporter MnhF subunit